MMNDDTVVSGSPYPKFLFLGLLCLSVAAVATADGGPTSQDTSVVVAGREYDSWRTFVQQNDVPGSDFRCSTPSKSLRAVLFPAKAVDPSDCSETSTNPTADYDPTEVLEAKVVIHILMDDACSQGAITDELVHSQIQILNEDFQALAGSNGAPGTNVNLRFVLADQDPQGNAHSGITRTCNTQYFNDGGDYFNTLNWDPNRYINIYTNDASGNLGYVPFLPMTSGGVLVGSAEDRVVNLWSAFGLNSPIGPPFHLGRTVTHEVGHYLGLEHTFTGGCATASTPGCYSSGDLICDTASESQPHEGCDESASSCGSADPIHNYMDYSDDNCMNQFTPEQVRRMRCAIQHYRPNLFTVATGSDEIFADGFESGSTSRWSS